VSEEELFDRLMGHYRLLAAVPGLDVKELMNWHHSLCKSILDLMEDVLEEGVSPA